MSPTRRTFLRIAAASGSAVGLGLIPRSGVVATDAPAIHTPRKAAKLRILILGGTGLIGPYQVQYAIDRGHTVTMFNRGVTRPDLFPGVERLIGDRASNLKSLEGREWDVVIDNSAQTEPDWVELSAHLLAPKVKTYIFVSSVNVYFDTSRVPMTIDAPVLTRENTPGLQAGRALPVGLAKSLMEKEAQKYFPGRTFIVRSGLIVGPGDLTDRFTYWPVRIERGGEVLAPGDGTDPVQLIDARDLSEWIIRAAEQNVTGTYNALGPRNPRSFAELLYGIKAVTSAEATFTWVDGDFLAANRVRGYQEMPLWRAPRGGYEGFARFDIAREVGLGLTFRPLAVTAKDTLDYYLAQPRTVQSALSAGITPEREKEVLALWRARGR